MAERPLGPDPPATRWAYHEFGGRSGVSRRVAEGPVHLDGAAMGPVQPSWPAGVGWRLAHATGDRSRPSRGHRGDPDPL